MLDIPIVVDVRGSGYFYAVELASHNAQGLKFTSDEKQRIYGTELLTDRLLERGLLLRSAVENGDPVLSVAPPLVADTAEFDYIVKTLREVLTILSGDAGFVSQDHPRL